MTPADLLTTPEAVISVPAAGQVLGLGQTASYDAAKRGDLPTIRVGARYLVPVAKLRELLGMPAWPAHDDAPGSGVPEGADIVSSDRQDEGVRHVQE